MSQYCDTCSVECQTEHVLQAHLIGKKHLKKLQQSQVAERSIVVSPLPKTIRRQDLINFFHGYGKVERYGFGANYVIIEFNNSEPTQTLLNRPVWINHVKLDIKKRMFQNGPNKGNEIKDAGPISYEKVKEVITKETMFKDQLSAFLNEVQLCDAEIESKYESIVVELNKIFKKIFPHCEAHKFGSTLARLCFKGCDLDVYIDIGETVYENEDAPPGSWTMQKIFKAARKIMYKMQCVFSDIISIPRAKTPIIKFRHVATDVSCDISFKNGIGIYKSRLIKHCISLDVRLKPLMMLIKYWSKHFEICGRGKLSSYALILLTIFYLQQPSVNIVPPLMKLQSRNPATTVNSWSVSLEENPSPLPVTNTNSIPQLLHGFFFFYSTFEFTAQIICPFDGLAHPDSKFKALEGLPEYMNTYVELAKTGKCSKFDVERPACLQDPIEHNNNVTASTPRTILRTFTDYCVIGAEICAATSKNDYRDLLITLFNTVQKRPTKKKKFQVFISGKYTECLDLPRNSAVPANVTGDSPTFAKDNWYYTVFSIIKNVFGEVFKLKLEILNTDADIEAKQQKIKALSDVHTDEHRKTAFQCTGSYKVWCNRKINGVILDPSLSMLEKEALISNETIRASAGDRTASRPELDCICIFQKKTQPLQVILTVRNETSASKTFNEFANFATSKIPKIVDQTLIHMGNFHKR